MNIPNLPNIPSLSNLPQIPEEMKTVTVKIRHFLLISHAVPVSRVQRLLPSGLLPDALKVQGQSCAILQTACFLNEDFHYTPVPQVNLDFWQSTYRILVRSAQNTEGTVAAGAAPAGAAPAGMAVGASSIDSAAATSSPTGAATVGVPAAGSPVRSPGGVFVVRSFLSTRASWVLQRAVATGAEYADFNVIQRSQEGSGEYSTFVADITSEDSTPTQLAARTVPGQTPVKPFASWDKMVAFLTNRPNNYYPTVTMLGRDSLSVMTTSFEELQPRQAELTAVGGETQEARLGVWEQLGLLRAAEMQHPFSVLIQPQLTVISQPAKTVREIDKR